ncbi:MAG TPA: hypothetical protein VK674_06760 [Candidatus Limnocylindria bacterium]|nr:hypothetical protein [Candidatus Limnocylindria bacterium]
MDPQEQEQTPSFELPPAKATERTNPPLPEGQYASPDEAQGATAVEQGISQFVPPPVAGSSPAQQSAAQDLTSGQSTGAVSAVPVTQTPQIADDTDLIEKEWVLRAKEIVAQTAHDPHLQNREMNKFKADYLKKRYNKAIKLSEDT